MMFKIYALRLRGDKEVRYIGQSANIEQRFAGHFGVAKAMPWPTDFALWLTGNEGNIELVELGRATTREDARCNERKAVELCLAMGHRLFNRHLVPAEKRCQQRTSPPPSWMRKRLAA